MSKQPIHILVIRLSAMGDVAMAIPVLRVVARQYPEVKITVLTRAFFKPFFRDLQNVTVFPAEVKGKHKGAFGLYKLARQLNKENHFYAIADLHSVLRSKVLKQFIRCKRFVSIDKGRKEKRLLTSGKLFEQLKTTHQRYANVFETLGFPLDLTNPIFPEKVVLNQKLKLILGEDYRKRIGIAPFAAHESKMYPLDLMKKVIESLAKDYKVILFGGGKNEIDVLNDFETAFKNISTKSILNEGSRLSLGVVNVAGKLSLDEEMDVISNLDVMLSMDSGNAHIAAMLGVKVVTIWGVTHPFAGFYPFNQPNDYALLPDRNQFSKIPTSVYGNNYPESYKEASRSISPEIVVEKIKSVI